MACGVGDTPLSTPRPPSDLVSWLSDTEEGVPQKKMATFPRPLPPKGGTSVHGAHIQIPVSLANLCSRGCVVSTWAEVAEPPCRF